ncbi:MAG: RNA polymerase sigma factor [Cellulomonas sp.]
MDPAVDDTAQWALSVEGDGHAFGVIFDRYRDRVFRHACRLVESRHDAEDVTAAAFLELWRRRRDVRLVAGSVLPWLLVTTSNVARNSSRSTRRYRQFLDRLPREPVGPDTADVAFRREIADVELGAALRSLSPQDLHLVTLVVLEGCSLAEAAVVLQLTPSAAKTRMHRARHRLRAAMGFEDATAAHDVVIGGRS